MAGITLEQAESMLSAWLTAEVKVATGQSYSMEGRSLTRADAGTITKKIQYWDQKVRSLSGTKNTIRRIIV